ncbi:hypothetical protein ACI3L1_15050 [Deinococcus sp. SM5_A1]|uniref:hypothetical protein n=1 Tax=Deinococcus sp. SM5_A1 TaxID=3379094 RepID=UPI00385C8FFE
MRIAHGDGQRQAEERFQAVAVDGGQEGADLVGLPEQHFLPGGLGRAGIAGHVARQHVQADCVVEHHADKRAGVLGSPHALIARQIVDHPGHVAGRQHVQADVAQGRQDISEFCRRQTAA